MDAHLIADPGLIACGDDVDQSDVQFCVSLWVVPGELVVGHGGLDLQSAQRPDPGQQGVAGRVPQRAMKVEARQVSLHQCLL